jgi:secondary thiamine-phosphate synthase enzyme
MVNQKIIKLSEYKRGFHLITNIIEDAISELPDVGIMNIFIQHTSAALSINENADPSVRYDMNNFINYLIPDGNSIYEHSLEGEDDMPAHIKSSLFGQSLTIPITNHRLNLGTWQGIYLCEFRNYGGSRKLIITVYGNS